MKNKVIALLRSKGFNEDLKQKLQDANGNTVTIVATVDESKVTLMFEDCIDNYTRHTFKEEFNYQYPLELNTEATTIRWVEHNINEFIKKSFLVLAVLYKTVVVVDTSYGAIPPTVPVFPALDFE